MDNLDAFTRGERKEIPAYLFILTGFAHKTVVMIAPDIYIGSCCFTSTRI